LKNTNHINNSSEYYNHSSSNSNPIFKPSNYSNGNHSNDHHQNNGSAHPSAPTHNNIPNTPHVTPSSPSISNVSHTPISVHSVTPINNKENNKPKEIDEFPDKDTYGQAVIHIPGIIISPAKPHAFPIEIDPQPISE
jgi:hypothetical protein